MRLSFFVLALVVLAAAPASAQVTVVPDFGATAVNVSKLMETRYPQTLALLKQEFPEDFAGLTGKIEEIDKERGDEQTLLTQAFEELTAVRRKYADKLVFAPTVAHATMLAQLAGFYDQVFKSEGAEVCGRFAHDGSAVLFQLGLSAKYARFLDQQSVAYFEAVVGAIEAPEYAGVVAPADWEAVMGRMITAGAPTSFAATIAGGRQNDPDLCPALGAMFLTSGMMSEPEGMRTRADFAKNLTGY